jgi:integrase
MPRSVLTPAVVLRLRPGKKRQLIWCDSPQSPPRFGVRLGASRAVYVVVVDGVWITLGNVRSVSLDDARKLARVAIGKAADGLDPRGDKVETSKVTVSRLLEMYIASRDLALATKRKYEEILKKHLGPMAHRQADSLIRSDWTKFLSSFESLSMRDYTLRLMRAAYRWGRDEEIKPGLTIVTRNPVHGIKEMVAGKRRERVLTDQEIKAVWTSVERLGPVKATYIRILLLLALRRGEAYLSKWDQIDLENGVWMIPSVIRKVRRDRVHLVPALIVPLPALAVELLRSMKPHTDGVRPFRLSVTDIARDMKLVSGVMDIAPHDLRRTAVRWMEVSACPPHILAAVLGRTGRLPGSEAADVHYVLGQRPAEVRVWLERWAERVCELVGNRP